MVMECGLIFGCGEGLLASWDRQGGAVSMGDAQRGVLKPGLSAVSPHRDAPGRWAKGGAPSGGPMSVLFSSLIV